MTIISHPNFDGKKFSQLEDSSLVRELSEPLRKRDPTEVKIAKEASQHVEASNKEKDKEKDLQNPKPRKGSKLEKLYEHIKSQGGEVFCPDSKSICFRTNCPGISIHCHEESSGNVSLEMHNSVGKTISGLSNLESPKQLNDFLTKEGLSISKVAKPELNKSSSSLYIGSRGFDR